MKWLNWLIVSMSMAFSASLEAQVDCNLESSFKIGVALAKPGEVTSVSLKGHSVCPTTAFAVAVTYDTNYLEFISALPGQWVTDLAGRDLFFQAGSYRSEGFSFVLGIWDLIPLPPTNIPPTPVPLDTELATLHFKVSPSAPVGFYNLINEPRVVGQLLISNCFAGPPFTPSICPVLDHGSITVFDRPITTQDRGDCNSDSIFDISDPIFTLLYLFVGGSTKPSCPEVCDVNGDAIIDLSDPVYSLNRLYSGGPSLIGGPVSCGGI